MEKIIKIYEKEKSKMTETYVSIGEVMDRIIDVLKYFALSSAVLLISIGSAVLAWMLTNIIVMILSIGGIMASTVALTIGIYELYIQKTKRR